MDILILFGLFINLFIQLFKKGHLHLSLYKQLNMIDEGESLVTTALTGSFYKYPMTILPFIEKIENLKGDDLQAYNILKKQNTSLRISILSIAVFFVVIYFYYK